MSSLTHNYFYIYNVNVDLYLKNLLFLSSSVQNLKIILIKNSFNFIKAFTINLPVSRKLI